MKKTVFLLFLLIPGVINASDNINFKWNVGNFGVGFFNNGLESFAEIVTIGIEHKNTRIGLEINPVRFLYLDYKDKNNVSNSKRISWSFLNLNLYWNIFDVSIFSSGIKFFFGPFNRINYIHMVNRVFNWNEFIYNAGFRCGITFNQNNNIYYNMISTEIGYRNNNGKSDFTISVKMDILLFYFIFFHNR